MKFSDSVLYPRSALVLALSGVAVIVAVTYLFYLSTLREVLQDLDENTTSLASLTGDLVNNQAPSPTREQEFVNSPAGKLLAKHFTSREVARNTIILMREAAGEPQLFRAKADRGFARDNEFENELSSIGRIYKTWPDGRGEFINHQGIRVLAAYAPVQDLDLAVFQRIEKDALTDRFVRRSAWISAVYLVCLGLFIAAQRKILAPNLSRIGAADYQRLLSTFETSPVLMVVLSPVGIIQEVNHAFSSLTGRTAEEVRGKVWVEEFIPMGHREHIQSLIHLAASGTRTRGYVNPILTRSGERMIEWYDNVWKNSRGEATSILAVGIDATDRLQALDAFRESEERYRQLVQSAPYCIHEIAATGEVVSINGAGLAMLGCNNAAEVEGKHYLEWVRREDQAQVASLFKAAVKGHASTYEFTSVNHRIFNSNFVPISSGKIMGITRDVTEQHAMAKREEERMHQLRQLSELSLMLAGEPNAVFIRIVRMIADLVNFPIVCHAEISDGELRFKTMFRRGEVCLDAGGCRIEVTPCATVEQTKDLQIYNRVAEAFPEAAFLSEYKAYTYCGFPAVDSSQKILAVIFLLDDKPRDIPLETQALLRVFGQRIAIEVERRNRGLAHEKVEYELQQSEARLRTAQSIGAIGNWELDHSLNSLWWSDQIFSIFELPATKSRLNFECFLNVVHPDDRTHVRQAFNHSISDRAPYQITHRLLTPDGRIKFVEERCETDFAEDGRPLLSRGTVQDVSARVRVEQELRELLAEKEMLVQEIHHRVKNNLQILSSLLHFQVKKADSPSGRGAFQDMQNRVRSMALIHERLYRTANLSRIDFGGYLSLLATELAKSYGRPARIEQRVVAENISLPIELAMPLGMLIGELVMNAFKHAFPHNKTGQIVILARQIDHHLVFQVMDDGIGLPPEMDIAAGKTFGWSLINALTSQISGTIECTRDKGTKVTIQIQAPSPAPLSA